MFLVYMDIRDTQNRSDQHNFSSPPRGGHEKKKKKRGGVSSQVRKQSLRYCGAFLIVWTFPTVARLIQLFGGTIPPILGVFAGAFIGAQGIFNSLIYFRPRYEKCVKYDTWYRKVWALVHSTLFFCCYDDDYTNDVKDYSAPSAPATTSSMPSSTAVPSSRSHIGTNPSCTEGNFNEEEKREEEKEDADGNFAITTIPA